jgi:hypothetical protein
LQNVKDRAVHFLWECGALGKPHIHGCPGSMGCNNLTKTQTSASENHLPPNTDIKISVQYNHSITILSNVQTNETTVIFSIFKVLNTTSFGLLKNP